VTVRGLFVTGTDTGVGKTALAASVIAALRAQGRQVRALKPLLTGLDEAADPGWPHDHELLAIAAGSAAAEVVLRSFGPPVSPHLAAELAGTPIDIDALLGEIAAAGGADDATNVEPIVVVEGVGGLLVPLGVGWDVRRLAAAIGLPVLIAARPGLGPINHTLLALEAARAGGLRLVGVVLTPWPERGDEVARSNLETIAELGEVEVATLPRVAADPAVLAAAGATLPLERWLSDRDGS
jgi:dethiobiotin synthetase